MKQSERTGALKIRHDKKDDKHQRQEDLKFMLKRVFADMSHKNDIRPADLLTRDLSWLRAHLIDERRKHVMMEWPNYRAAPEGSFWVESTIWIILYGMTCFTDTLTYVNAWERMSISEINWRWIIWQKQRAIRWKHHWNRDETEYGKG